MRNSPEKYYVKLGIHEWKRYPEYKDSGVKWIGDIPKEWNTIKLKFISKIINGSTPNSAINELWDGEILWITPYDLGSLEGKEIVDSARKITRLGLNSCGTTLTPKNSVILSTRAPIGHIAITNIETCTNQGCKTIVPNSEYNSEFLHYYLFASKNLLQSLGQGSTFIELSSQNLKEFEMTFPFLEEQQKIVSFLNCETAKIDAIIEKKQLFITLLEEKRSTLISHMVTKGLDPAVRMKDSGVEWIGEIPEHWKIISVRNMIRSKRLEVQDGNHGELHPKTEDYVPEGIPFIMANDIKNRNIDFHSCKKIPVELATSLRIGFSKADDVLLTHKGTVGEVAIVPKNIEWPFIMLTPQVTYYRVKTDNLLSEFLFLFLQSKAIKHQLNLIGSHQSTRNYVGILAQGDLLLLIPPVEEQSIIHQSLNKETEKIDTLINKISAQIEKLKEYRTALISAAVTGKIDVREEVA